MKTFKTFAIAAIVALVSATGFTSCKDGNDAKNEPNPEQGNYTGETVKTQFLISIAENVSRTNRMPAATIQDGGLRTDFRGMDSIVLIPFSDGLYATRNGRNITLGSIAATDAGTVTAGNMNAQNSVFYEDVAIPLGTNHFLFYGKAIDNTENTLISTVADKHKFGILESSKLRDGATPSNFNPADISFKLKSIYEASSNPDKSAAIATLLTNIANAASGEASWNSAAKSNDALFALHEDFITLKAGSSHSVESTLEDLYNTLKRYQLTLVTPDAASQAVIDAIEVGCNVTGSALPYTLALKDAYAGYPANVNLPDGAAGVLWNAGTSSFAVAVSAVGGLGVSSFNQYTFPASLHYYGESAIKTSVDSKKQWYDGTNNWETILSKYEADNATVAQSTKSVALKNDINYAVGQLKVNVKHAATLKDNKGYDYEIPAAGMVWTGILIGGQKVVDYKFEQKSAEPATFVIYDNDLNGKDANGEVKLESANVKSNSTLVLSSKDNDDKSDEIYFALEFVNKGADFYGKDGLVPAGGKFYLVGSLKANGTEANHPAKWNIFFKDYRTVANVTVASLANAYNVIPDLRSQGMELGFSVDLVWQDGLSFDVVLN
ncbi:MAG: hypothetical protein IJU35_06030 [Paludibacteraceae bacterium]|nr:hypothetical protein [Paludibacteraceae bacterium]